ncbi:MAG: rhomboid family intramembrane serine protease [Pseudomonadota bacterium]
MNNLTIGPAAIIFALTAGISLFALYRNPRLINRFAMRPYQVSRGRDLETVITSGFVHGDMSHLFFNLFTFYFFAFQMERFLGPAAFLLLYLLGLIVSSVCSIVKERNNSRYATIGASGAISAVLFAYIVYFPASKLIIFPIPIPIPAFLFAIGYVGYSMWAAKQNRDNVNHDAHLCGAATGLAFVLAIDPGAFMNLLS